MLEASCDFKMSKDLLSLFGAYFLFYHLVATTEAYGSTANFQLRDSRHYHTGFISGCERGSRFRYSRLMHCRPCDLLIVMKYGVNFGTVPGRIKRYEPSIWEQKWTEKLMNGHEEGCAEIQENSDKVTIWLDTIKVPQHCCGSSLADANE